MVFHPSSTRAIYDFTYSVRNLFPKPRQTFDYIQKYFNISSNLLFYIILIQLIGYLSKLLMLSHSLFNNTFLVLIFIIHSEYRSLFIPVSLIFFSEWSQLPIDPISIISRFLSLHLIKNIFDNMRIRFISQYFIEMNGENIIQKYYEMIVFKIIALSNAIYITVTRYKFIIFYFQVVHIIGQTTSYSKNILLRKGFKLFLSQ